LWANGTLQQVLILSLPYGTARQHGRNPTAKKVANVLLSLKLSINSEHGLPQVMRNMPASPPDTMLKDAAQWFDAEN